MIIAGMTTTVRESEIIDEMTTGAMTIGIAIIGRTTMDTRVDPVMRMGEDAMMTVRRATHAGSLV